MIKKNAIKGSCVRMDMNVVMDARKQSRKEDAGRRDTKVRRGDLKKNIHAMKGKFRVHMESYIPRNGIGVTRLRSRGCLSTKEAGYSNNVKRHCRDKTK